MSGSFDNQGRIDIHRGLIASFFGRKGSGKSIMALLFFRNYPGDRVVIDIAGDDGPVGPDVHTLTGTVDDLAGGWPEHLRKDNERMTVHYRPDAGSATFLEDMDAVVGMAMAKGDCCILVHEVGVLAPANRTPPNTRRLLMHNRHQRVTALFCGPRPKDIDILVLGQSDLVYTFDVPNPADRRRIADTIGVDPSDFDAYWQDLKAHEYLRFDVHEEKPDSDDEPDKRLVHFPPLPLDVVNDVKGWSQGVRKSAVPARQYG